MVVLGIKYWLALETRGKYDLDMKPLDSRDCDLAEAVKDKVLVTSGFRINTGQQISWWGTNSYFVLNIPGFDNPLNIFKSWFDTGLAIAVTHAFPLTCGCCCYCQSNGKYSREASVYCHHFGSNSLFYSGSGRLGYLGPSAIALAS